jgi:hypothetical protein
MFLVDQHALISRRVAYLEGRGELRTLLAEGFEYPAFAPTRSAPAVEHEPKNTYAQREARKHLRKLRIDGAKHNHRRER